MYSFYTGIKAKNKLKIRFQIISNDYKDKSKLLLKVCKKDIRVKIMYLVMPYLKFLCIRVVLTIRLL